jgi:hypothetical protein
MRPTPPVELVQIKQQLDVDCTEKSHPATLVVLVIVQAVFGCSAVVVLVKNVVVPITGWAITEVEDSASPRIKNRKSFVIKFVFRRINFLQI